MSEERQAFLKRWRQEGPAYLAWGNFVAAKVDELVTPYVESTTVELFLRMPVKARLKDEESLLTKAFIRKRYANPYEDVEDKVGIRFVVLLSDDVRAIEQGILDGTAYWLARRARDFELERAERPFEFSYQSLHYVVYSKFGNQWEGTDIPEGFPCEIQVRTLLQHAYSELTHDTIYKPTVTATPEMQRAAAKSMALIEATDDYFKQVSDVIKVANATFRLIQTAVCTEYEKRIGRDYNEGVLNSLLIDHYRSMVSVEFAKDLAEFLDSKPYIEKRVSARAKSVDINSLPAVLLVYFCVAKAPNAARHDSPLDDTELAPIYADLGI